MENGNRDRVECNLPYRDIDSVVVEMSYDIRLGVKVEGTDIIAVIAAPEYSSPTYNLGDMFRACMGWDFKQGEWYNVSEVLPNILKGITELSMYPKKYREYEPDNGWGTVKTALSALQSLAECISEQNDGSAWQDIPYEHLWLRW